MEIADVNDNVPQFSKEVYTHEVLENTEKLLPPLFIKVCKCFLFILIFKCFCGNFNLIVRDWILSFLIYLKLCLLNETES